MTIEPPPGLEVDDAYWQSLLQDVEAHAPETSRANNAHGRAASESRRADPDSPWQAAQQAHENGELIDIVVTGYNRGGLLVEWNGLHGFLPSSHIIGLASHVDEDGRRIEMSRRVGARSCAKVIEIDRAQGRFVVSERAADSGNSRRAAALSQLSPGQIQTGVITNVCSFGAFVDLGGMEGLLHISEISWGRVNHPSDLLQPGQQVTIQIMSVDPAQNRVALSIKRLAPDPWASVEQRYQIGQVLEGVVTSVVNFGAFVRLEEGLEGLIHISELAEGSFLHPRNVVREGQAVRVCILNIDGGHRRLGLSLRQMNGAPLSAQASEGAQGNGP